MLPQADPSFTPHQLPYATERWLEWRPWMFLEARNTLDPAARLHELKTIHARRLRDLLSAGIRWDTIKRERLDHPALSEAAFEERLQWAKRRRYTRAKTNASRP